MCFPQELSNWPIFGSSRNFFGSSDISIYTGFKKRKKKITNGKAKAGKTMDAGREGLWGAGEEGSHI